VHFACMLCARLVARGACSEFFDQPSQPTKGVFPPENCTAQRAHVPSLALRCEAPPSGCLCSVSSFELVKKNG